MREIKFRAWDKNNEVMIYSEDNQNDDFTFIAERGGLHFYYIDSNDRCLMDTYSILMQYTGLKDKNDKEIYEEDECIFYGRFGKEKGIIKFLRHGFHIVLESGAGFKIDEFHLEVIGNIYENPELLEVN